MSPRWWRMLGAIGWAAIAALSVVPSSARPHTGAGGVPEHFMAYALVAGCWAMGQLPRRAFLGVLATMVLGAGLFEIAQLYVPGRTAEWAGLWSAAAGVCIGALAGSLVKRV